jgi:DNA-binding LacI/PurR family transcriptional regulator
MNAHIHAATEPNGSGQPGEQARTLEEVARLAGVSRNTVSLAIRNSPRVQARTRERVLRVVRETGYRPNHAARALAGRRTRTIGAVFFGDSRMATRGVDSFYGAILAGIRHALDRADHDLLLISSGRLGPAHDLAAPLETGRADGLIVLGVETDRAAVRRARAAGAPLVHIGRRDFGRADVPYVSADEPGGMALALRHLVEHGHRRVAVVAEDLAFEPTADKVVAARRVAAEVGLPADAILALEATPADGASLDACVARLLGAGVTAALPMRAPLAVALVRALRASGVRVPEGFALVGYGNGEWTPLTEPPLTCISPPLFAMGVAAGELVLELIEDGATAAPRILPNALVVRRSCGCAWSPPDEGRGPPS